MSFREKLQIPHKEKIGSRFVTLSEVLSPERSEGTEGTVSVVDTEILRFAQNDRRGEFVFCEKS